MSLDMGVDLSLGQLVVPLRSVMLEGDGGGRAAWKMITVGPWCCSLC